MRFIDQVKTALKRRTCGQCGGKGYMVNRAVDEFIQKYGLDTYQVAATMMRNEEHYGRLGSLPVSAWELVGLSPEGSREFSTEVGLVHEFRACAACGKHKNHPTPLHTAMAAIEKLTAERKAEFQEFLAYENREPAGE